MESWCGTFMHLCMTCGASAAAVVGALRCGMCSAAWDRGRWSGVGAVYAQRVIPMRGAGGFDFAPFRVERRELARG